MKTYLIQLPGIGNYAIVAPDRIVFALDASEAEKEEVIKEEENRKPRKERRNTEEIIESAHLAIIPTFDCNLRCIYCYALGGECAKSLSLSHVIAVLSNMKAMNSVDVLDLHLVGGGEPLLRFARVQEIVAYAKSLYRDVRIHVVTNGTFGGRVFQWLTKQDCTVRVSYDGVIHDIQRPYKDGKPSGRKVRETIKGLVAEGVPVMSQTIITSLGVDKMRESVEEIANLGVKVLKLEPAIVTEVSRGTVNLMPNALQYAHALLEVIDFVARSGLNLKIDTGFFSPPSEGHYCGISTGNRILTPNGFLTACVEVARPTDPFADPVIFGKVKRNSRVEENQQRVKKLQTLHPINYLGGCGKCNLSLLCLGGCPMSNIWQNGFPVRKSKYTCAIEHAFLPELLLKIAVDKRVANVILERDAVMTTC